MAPLKCILSIVCALCLCSCHQVLSAVNPKSLAPEVIEAAQQKGNWYGYLPQYAPYFCLVTQDTLMWKDPQMKLGYWRARHPSPPHRLLMEARGDTFILHRSYVWDGMTWGRTEKRDLLPSLLHDALYHALQDNAPFPRREADRAFLRARRATHVFNAYGEYLAIRWFGGLFNEVHTDGEKTIIVEPMPSPNPG